ncbi:MAG: phosphate signaling complex protein PhoU [Akkermansiaceae bacterium]|nr:phosphate signaling complex protein PhoU [Akkermansiaceae bacterium]
MSAVHISRDFDHAIFTLRKEVLTMAANARRNLEGSIRSLLDRDMEQANIAISDVDEVKDCEWKIDQLGMEILLRYHPVAGDLRLVISSMKIAMNLERICGHALNIAKRAKKMNAAKELLDVTLIEPLYTMADHLLRDAISAYSDRNATLGASLCEKDKALDRMHDSVTATFISRIETGNGRSQDYLHLLLMTRSLERIGDLAVMIGKDAVFLGNALISGTKATTRSWQRSNFLK